MDRANNSDVDLVLPVSMICNDIDTRVHFALEGLGIARLPDFSVRELVLQGRLREVLSEYVEGTNTLFVLWPAFVDMLRCNLFATSPEDG